MVLLFCPWMCIFFEIIGMHQANSKDSGIHSFDDISFSRSSVQPHPFKNFLHQFDPIHSKIFFIRSAIRPYLFENFLHPFSCLASSVRKFPLAIQPLSHPFENFLHPFSRSLYPFRTAGLPVSHLFACRAFNRSNGYR